jgi:hypothetical protein
MKKIKRNSETTANFHFLEIFWYGPVSPNWLCVAYGILFLQYGVVEISTLVADYRYQQRMCSSGVRTDNRRTNNSLQ